MEGITEPITSTTGYMNPKISISATCFFVTLYVFAEIYIYGIEPKLSAEIFTIQLVIMGSVSVIVPPLFGNFKQEIIFSGKILQLEVTRTLFGFRPLRSVKFNWSDVIAWQQSQVWFDMFGADPFSIDILVNDNGKRKIYRTWGVDIKYKGEKIRFDEYKQRIKPFLDARPNQPELFNEMSKHNKGWSIFFLALGIIFTVSTVGLFILMANGGRIVPEIGFFGMMGMIFLGISKTLNNSKRKSTNA